MALLGRDQILSSTSRSYQVVPVPEWGGEVRLQSLTGKERDKFEASLSKRKNGKEVSDYENARAKLIAACAVDENGNLIFTNRFDIEKLGEAPVSALQKLFNVCQAMNGMSDADLEELIGDFDQTADSEGPSSSD